jgi:hypothetical protein
VLIQDRLISRSSRSLAVMIGFARSAKGGGREGLRGSPDTPLFAATHVCSTPSRSTPEIPASEFG